MKAKIVKTHSGTSKAGNPYKTVTLHDPLTLENADVFLPQGSTIDLTRFKPHDEVEAVFDNVLKFGKIQMELVMLDHIKK